MTTVDKIMELFAQSGKTAYFGEMVSQTEHALQTADFAVRAGADDQLVTAALLHDVGHLLRGLPENAAKLGVDDTHEEVGAAWLAAHFGPAVSVPVRLHVPAKRYLCSVEPAYLAQLSSASQLSLRLQGGPMSQAESHQFEQDPYFAAAIALRRWDDAAKVPGLIIADLEHYRATLAAALGENRT